MTHSIIILFAGISQELCEKKTHGAGKGDVEAGWGHWWQALERPGLLPGLVIALMHACVLG